MFGFKQETSGIPTSVLYHYATMVYCLVISMDSTRYIHPLRHTVPSGWCWTSGAGPAPPPAPATTSLVRTSTWISTSLLGSSDMAQDRSPAKKQVPAGELVGFGALGAHKAGCSASESWASHWYTGLTCHECHCDQQESGD
jgi:hypothetical protein